jgi:hypothetical protein
MLPKKRIEDLIKRINEIIEMGNSTLKTQKHYEMSGSYVDYHLYCGFRSAGLSFLERVFGTNHTYYNQFKEAVNSSTPDYVMAGMEILKATADEIRGGWMVTIKGLISGEILGDFIDLAKGAIDGNKDVAAVLVSAALEDTLKRLAVQQGLDVQDKDMSDVVGALKTKGLLQGAQGSLASGYIKLRNKSFHAEWDKIEKPEISSAISFTEQLLLEYFG